MLLESLADVCSGDVHKDVDIRQFRNRPGVIDVKTHGCSVLAFLY